MAAVLGLNAETISRSLPSDGVAVVANDNCPGQIVISGDAEAVKQAAEALKTAGAKRCLPLNVSGAFHSPLMADAAERMRDAVATVDFSAGSLPVVSNVTAQPESDWPELLIRQLVSPVRWTESVRTMLTMGTEEFVEFGPGDVLTGLLKRIAPEASGWNFDSRETKD
jgi:[acyl-carrier-protein] S-malonyltransferase